MGMSYNIFLSFNSYILSLTVTPNSPKRYSAFHSVNRFEWPACFFQVILWRCITMQNHWSSWSEDITMDTEDLPANNAPLTVNEQVFITNTNIHDLFSYIKSVSSHHVQPSHLWASLIPPVCGPRSLVSSSNSLLVVRGLWKHCLC